MQDINLRNELILNISPLEDVPISIRNDFKRIQAAVFRHLLNTYISNEDRDSPDRTNA